MHLAGFLVQQAWPRRAAVGRRRHAAGWQVRAVQAQRLRVTPRASGEG
ncbi:hypothetical protein PSTAB_0039 [Stutzerimonas stutzeri]|uniref:Uncharacterized protein n=1 Tax=Stutzerimonas stutzeri (strain ATCC 17588 / DSM 5190 / CCUG 11256 / JCM 5965 / LMG 11199 / NBRC 14165 / NCIMB 11358 / Stanier 221) TaxID=96563 RepID=F8H3A4_STUS2|nr:hypothetical protein PSTAB_0039 [Stutzerimonas stutzeri]AKN24957.1 hypothetical protein AB691_0034 [Stutzerimonas stutzeri]